MALLERCVLISAKAYDTAPRLHINAERLFDLHELRAHKAYAGVATLCPQLAIALAAGPPCNGPNVCSGPNANICESAFT